MLFSATIAFKINFEEFFFTASGQCEYEKFSSHENIQSILFNIPTKNSPPNSDY